MIRDREQLVAVCNALTVKAELGRLWEEVDGPSKRATALMRKSAPIGPWQRTLLGAAWECWNQPRKTPFADVAFGSLDHDNQLILGELVVALAQGTQAVDLWLDRWAPAEIPKGFKWDREITAFCVLMREHAAQIGRAHSRGATFDRARLEAIEKEIAGMLRDAGERVLVQVRDDGDHPRNATKIVRLESEPAAAPIVMRDVTTGKTYTDRAAAIEALNSGAILEASKPAAEKGGDHVA